MKLLQSCFGLSVYAPTPPLKGVMLVQCYNAKLADFGLAKDGPSGDQTHVSTRVMGTYGYAAPEYVMTGLSVFANFPFPLFIAVFKMTLFVVVIRAFDIEK